MPQSDVRVLVTGATGFVGTALLKQFAAEGINYVPVYRRASAPIGQPTTYIVDAINGQTNWANAFDGVSTIVHLAARVHVLNDRVEDPLSAYRDVNLHGTTRLAERAAAAGVRRFVFVSSIKVNGSATTIDHPYTAQSQPAPDDPYGISKLEAERALAEISASTGMEVVVIRPPLVYGPGVGANFRQLMLLAKSGIPLPLASVRHNRRSLVAVGNLSDLIIRCCTHPAAAGNVFVVSDGEDVSTADLLKRLSTAMGRPPMLLPFPVSLMEFAARLLGRQNVANRLFGSLQVDISQTREILGWAPPFGLDEALAATVNDLTNSPNG